MSKLLGRLFGKQDREKNSGIPIEPPTGAKPLTMQEMIKRYIREQVAADLGNKPDEVDSFEDADDFEEEDPDTIPLTHHQVIAMDENELREHARAYGVDLIDDGSPIPDLTPPGSPQKVTPGNMATDAQSPVAGSSGG